MTLFQKLKIKLFGKERWRVVGCYCPIRVGDVVFYHKSCLLLEIRDDFMAVALNRQSNSFNRRIIYRKVN